VRLHRFLGDTEGRGDIAIGLAPIAFIPIALALKRGASPTIELTCRGEGVDLVMPNTALLAWLEQQTGKLHAAEIFAFLVGEDLGGVRSAIWSRTSPRR